MLWPGEVALRLVALGEKRSSNSRDSLYAASLQGRALSSDPDFRELVGVPSEDYGARFFSKFIAAAGEPVNRLSQCRLITKALGNCLVF